MRKKIILACSQCNSRNYVTMKNVNHFQQRFETNKFCKTCNAHTTHRETK
ncbi:MULTISPECIES: 50S ribosomal protein L33 [Parageobacillus]|uniref:Large ribosomal subunit protein bL33 n=1 Tax=Parageobacillus thermoglucosidasius TaxID=1426 RepID=A0A1B7KV57_PARTM|nr:MULTISPECIES: 50S ribosomal protein L33 [Parageobacillus]OAT73933.1 50S ribosomal protein L33 [Parageobacillus thermoglucosidasius]